MAGKPTFKATIQLKTWTPNCERKANARQRYKNDFKGRESRWMGSGIVPPKKSGSGRSNLKLAHAPSKAKK